MNGWTGGSAPKRTSVELFAGAGGLSLGLHNAGFCHAALVEYEGKACDTLRRNAERWEENGEPVPPWRADQVHARDVRDFLDSEDMPTEDVTLLAGGPPCQPFSMGGLHAGDRDVRNMFPVVMDYVRELRPALVLLENVAGLTRERFRPLLDYVQRQLEFPLCAPRANESMKEHAARLERRVSGPLRTRYRVMRQVVDSADFGVPQRRHRVFIMAVRADLGDRPPPPLHGGYSESALFWDQWITGEYWEKHGVAPPDPPKDLDEETRLAIKKAGPPADARWRTVRDAISGLPKPVDRQPTQGVLNHVGIPGARAYKGHTGSPIDQPSKTIKAGVHGVCGGEAMIRFHDGQVRYLTVRESARMQTFPDDYEFVGARSNAMRHIGNAVSVDVGEAVARHLRTHAGL